MINFWDFSVWGSFMLFAVLLASLLAANILKKSIPFLEKSLIPTSVLGGGILLVIAFVYKLITGDVMFDTAFFGGNFFYGRAEYSGMIESNFCNYRRQHVRKRISGIESPAKSRFNYCNIHPLLGKI